MSQPDLSVIVVSYNTRELTLECLRSLYAQTEDISFEVILVDNASSDGSADAIRAEFPDVSVLEPGENLGFARANNLAARQATGERLLLLNSDTVVLERAIDRLVAFATAQPMARIWGGRTVFEDGSLNIASCCGRPSPWSVFCRATGIASLLGNPAWCDRETMSAWPRDSVRQVDVVSGCFFLIDRSLWHDLGGFEEAFFMYGEELDLCLRAHRHGAKPIVTPKATIVHYGGRSESAVAAKTVLQFQSRARVYRRHWNWLAAIFGVAMLDVWVLRRLFVDLALLGAGRGSAERVATWRAVWRRRTEWTTAT